MYLGRRDGNAEEKDRIFQFAVEAASWAGPHFMPFHIFQ
jgi:hypothetical protein